MCLSTQTKKGKTTLGMVIYQNYHGEIELPLHNGVKKDCVWGTGDLLGHLFVVLCLVIKVNGKLQHLIQEG